MSFNNNVSQNVSYVATMQMPRPMPIPMLIPGPVPSSYSLRPRTQSVPHSYRDTLPMPVTGDRSGSSHSRASSWTAQQMFSPPNQMQQQEQPRLRRTSGSPSWSRVIPMPQQQQQSVPQTPRQVQPQITYQPAPPSPYRERPPPLQPQPQVSDKPRRSPPSPIQFPIRQPEPLPQPPRIITSPSAQQPTRPPPTVRSTHARRQGSGSRTPSANSVPQLPNPNPNPSRPPAITATSNTTVSSSRPSSTDVVINLPLVAKTAGPTRPASKPPQIAPKPDEPTRRSSFVEHLFHHHHHHHEAKEEQPPQQPSPALTRPVPIRKRSSRPRIPKSALHNPNVISRKKSKRKVHFVLDQGPFTERIKIIFGPHVSRPPPIPRIDKVASKF